MAKKEVAKVSDFQKNRNNPFIEEAIEQIENSIVKKYRNSTGTSKDAILQAMDSSGNPAGHTTFIRQIEVDEDQFVKVYLSQFEAWYNLQPQGLKVFGYILSKLQPRQDLIPFFMYECLEFTQYKGEKSIYIGLANLLENNIIARGMNENFYFINPMIAFNGDRVTFAKSYVKKQKRKSIDPNQTNILDQIKEITGKES
jgi:hypothetical protein